MSLKCGVGEVPLAFPDGLGLAGYGPLAGTGIHNEDSTAGLFARVLSLHDEATDTRIHFVFVDLWTGSSYVHQRVCDALSLADHQVLMVGTHTHSAPGHFSGNRLYDAFGQSPGGFREDIANHIADAIITAIGAAVPTTPCKLTILRSTAPRIGRLRSLDAYLRNFPPSSDWASTWRRRLGVPLEADAPTDPHELGVDPRLWSLWAFDLEGRLIATFATTTTHNASLGRDFEAYHPDWAGVAVAALRRALGPVWASVAQGAAGDVTAIPVGRTFRSLGLPLTQRIGEAFGAAWAALRDEASALATDQRIELGFDRWRPGDDHLDDWSIGQPVINGCDESRSPWYLPILGEPRTSLIPWAQLERVFGFHHDQAPKQRAFYAFDPVIRRFFCDLAPAPEHPLHLVRIGNHAFFTIPGEVTGVAALRLERALLNRAARVGLGLVSASAIGLTNDFCGYVTTEAEYDAQHYEGAHNLYGRRTLAAVERRFTSLLYRGGLHVDPTERFEVGPKDRMSSDEFQTKVMRLIETAALPLRIAGLVERGLRRFTSPLRRTS